MVRDQQITLPPIGGSVLNYPSIITDAYAQNKDYWTPKNYGGGSAGVTTLRRALENSKTSSPPTCSTGGIESSAPESLQRVCGSRGRSAALQGVRSLLSVRARCAAGAAGRSGGVLCRGRQRGGAPDSRM